MIFNFLPLCLLLVCTLLCVRVISYRLNIRATRHCMLNLMKFFANSLFLKPIYILIIIIIIRILFLTSVYAEEKIDGKIQYAWLSDLFKVLITIGIGIGIYYIFNIFKSPNIDNNLLSSSDF